MKDSASDRGPAAAQLRVLLVGEWHSDIHEEAWRAGLVARGHEVHGVAWHTRFGGGSPLSHFVGRVQNKLGTGPAVWRLNAQIVREGRRFRPDAVILYRPTLVIPVTLRALRRVSPGVVIATYNNDDPFGERAPWMLWRHYWPLVRLADVNMVYRHKNVRELESLGARNVALVRSHYVPERHRPIPVTADERTRLSADVVFIGHYEPDGRREYLRAVAESGVDFKLFGPDWNRAPAEPWLARFRPVVPLRGEQYVRSIAAARIALCLFSGSNNDTYTRRVFEITAIGAMLVSQRTDDMLEMFREGQEAEYFSVTIRAGRQAPLLSRQRTGTRPHRRRWSASRCRGRPRHLLADGGGRATARARPATRTYNRVRCCCVTGTEGSGRSPRLCARCAGSAVTTSPGRFGACTSR